MNRSNEKSTLQFLEWANRVFPGSKRKILKAAEMNGLQQTETKEAWYDKLISAASDILPVYTQYKVQKEIVDLQLDRAKQGLPPLDPSQYTAAPIRVEHGAAPGAIAQGVSPQVWTALATGGLILIGLIALPAFMGGRKRRR